MATPEVQKIEQDVKSGLLALSAKALEMFDHIEKHGLNPVDLSPITYDMASTCNTLHNNVLDAARQMIRDVFRAPAFPGEARPASLPPKRKPKGVKK